MCLDNRPRTHIRVGKASEKSVRNACAFRCFLGVKINIYGRYFKVFLENYLSSVKCVTGGAEPIYRRLVVNFISLNRTGCSKYQQGAGRSFPVLSLQVTVCELVIQETAWQVTGKQVVSLSRRLRDKQVVW